MTRCKLQAKKCKFRDDKETSERLIEQLIIGTVHKKVQETLLGRDEKLTLDEALDIVRTREATDAQMKQLIGGASGTTVHQVTKSYNRNQQSPSKCFNCGGNHPFQPRDRCPAFGSECELCHKMNHWSQVCMSTRGRSRNPRSKSRSRRSQSRNNRYRGRPASRSRDRREVHEVRDNRQSAPSSLSESFENLSFESVQSSNCRDEVFANIDIVLENRPQTPATLKVKVDTGAQGNLLPLRIYRRMYPEQLDSEGFPMAGAIRTQTNTVLSAYNGSRIVQYGSISIPCRYQDKACEAAFYVTDSSGPAIMGLPTLQELQLVTLNCSIKKHKNSDTPRIATKENLVQMYPDRFEGIGHFKGKFHITVDPSVPPVVHAPRRCPIHVRDELKNELETMVQSGVITKVTEPTDWVSSLAYSRKSNGKLRVCLDPKDLNKAIKRPHYKTPTLDEINHKFSGATVFSKLDARHGYWSVELDSESSRLTTFNSPFGRHCFLRLPFGLNLSQDVFQERMDHILEQCPGTTGIADDVAVFGKDQADHDNNLRNLMQVAQENGLVFNPDKCEINKPSITFFGMVYDANGVHPDPDKVQAIRDMEAPKDAKQLQEFLGMVTYLSPFLPHVSQNTAPLRELMKKGVVFEWNPSHQSAYDKLISLICREATLTYFDPQQPTVLQVDASSKGLGAVLIQNDKPIAYASKALTDCEQRYANIERELLAVVFGCEKFHTYLYGKHFLVESDHKPLEMIHLKNISAAPQRLQRMLLRIQNYDLKIQYKPGKEVGLADALSRTPGRENQAIDLDVNINLVQFSTQKQEELRDATSTDRELCDLKEIITQGWPERQRQLPHTIRKYWSYRDELTVQDGIVMKGERAVIPVCMQPYILAKLHESHQGIEKTKLRARTCVFWNNINADIENLVKRCDICQQHQKDQRQEPLLQHEIPTRPWETVGTDLFHLDGDDYFLICDYYSKFPIVRKIRGKASSEVIVNIMKDIFAEQGVPNTVISDNGPQYDSSIFKQFAEKWEFRHTTSSPRFPQSNGFIERQVQTVKNTLKKAKIAKVDPQMALLILRSTPVDSHLPSPSEMLNNRKVRANLPTKIDNRTIEKDSIVLRLQERQALQKMYYDNKSGGSLTTLTPGQSVRVQDSPRSWRPAVVKEKLSTPRSYEVETLDGSKLRRNRRHIRETLEKFEIPPETSSLEVHDTSGPETRDPVSPIKSPKHVRFKDNSDSDTYYTRSGRPIKNPRKLDL